jgi:hypothetical protein
MYKGATLVLVLLWDRSAFSILSGAVLMSVSREFPFLICREMGSPAAIFIYFD